MRGKGATIAELDCANVWVAGGEPDSWDVDDMVDKLDVLEALIPVEPAASIRGSDVLPGKYRSSSTTYHPKRLRRASTKYTPRDVLQLQHLVSSHVQSPAKGIG